MAETVYAMVGGSSPTRGYETFNIFISSTIQLKYGNETLVITLGSLRQFYYEGYSVKLRKKSREVLVEDFSKFIRKREQNLKFFRNKHKKKN